MRCLSVLAAFVASVAYANPEISAELPGGVTMDFVLIDPGTFLMGSPSSEPGRGNNEGPQHEVTISAGFYLGKYEVTQGQWEAVMGTTPWSGKISDPDNPGGENFYRANPTHPAVHLWWVDAHAFTDRLNETLEAGRGQVNRCVKEIRRPPSRVPR